MDQDKATSAREQRQTARNAQRDAEMERGRKQIKIDMARGLIEEIQRTMDVERRFRFNLVYDAPDPRQWGVRVDFNNGQAHSESWWEFPTDELRTKIMLFGGKSRGDT